MTTQPAPTGSAEESAGTEQTDRGRLHRAHDLRYRGEASQFRSALFTAYVVALLGIVYGVMASHYVFQTWPTVRSAVADHPVRTLAAVVLLVLGTSLLAYVGGARRGPVVPEPGHLEFIVATDLPRGLTLRDAWRSSCVVVATGLLGLGIAVPGGLAVAGGPGWVVAAGVAAALIGAPALLYSWLLGQARGQLNPPAHPPGRTPGALLDGLPMTTLRTQSLMSEGVTSALLAGDTRRARAEAFVVRLGRRPRRIRIAGPRGSVLGADLAGLVRAGWVSLCWLVVQVSALVLTGLSPVVRSRSALVFPIVLVLAHLTVSGLTRGLQHHATTVGEPSILGIGWQEETLLHLGPVAVLQFLTPLATALLTGVAPGAALLHALTVALALVGGQLFFVHKGPPPLALMATGGGRGIGAVWSAYPMLLVAVVALAGIPGPGVGLIVAALATALGWTRASAAFAPARPR